MALPVRYDDGGYYGANGRKGPVTRSSNGMECMRSRFTTYSSGRMHSRGHHPLIGGKLVFSSKTLVEIASWNRPVPRGTLAISLKHQGEMDRILTMRKLPAWYLVLSRRIGFRTRHVGGSSFNSTNLGAHCASSIRSLGRSRRSCSRGRPDRIRIRIQFPSRCRVQSL